jgi:hypothetical protein
MNGLRGTTHAANFNRSKPLRRGARTKRADGESVTAVQTQRGAGFEQGTRGAIKDIAGGHQRLAE